MFAAIKETIQADTVDARFVFWTMSGQTNVTHVSVPMQKYDLHLVLIVYQLETMCILLLYLSECVVCLHR